jgi:ESF2/ABP1 family protein
MESPDIRDDDVREGEDGDGLSIDNLDGDDDLDETVKRHEKNAEKIRQKVLAFKEKEMRKGVCYLSRVPPYMKVSMIRRLLKVYGVERIYLEPESIGIITSSW